MINIDKKDKASLVLLEKKANPNKFKFFTYEPPKNVQPCRDKISRSDGPSHHSS